MIVYLLIIYLKYYTYRRRINESPGFVGFHSNIIGGKYETALNVHS